MWKIQNIFRRQERSNPLPLRIEGCVTALTPQPDDAELAAEALLESLAAHPNHKNGIKKLRGDGKSAKEKEPEKGTAAYYRRLSDRICECREIEARLATRYVSYCEMELKNPLMPLGQVASLERELYRRLDIVEREGGDLKRRWQHCLATVTVRLMNVPQTDGAEVTGDADGTGTDLTS